MARVNYSAAKRRKAVQFILDWDSEHGRGGTAQATKKFKITFPTLKNWMAASGKPAKKKPGRKAAVAPKTIASRKVTSKAVKSSGAHKDILARLDKIVSCQSQIDALRNQIEKEKAAIRNILG